MFLDSSESQNKPDRISSEESVKFLYNLQSIYSEKQGWRSARLQAIHKEFKGTVNSEV